MDNIVIARIEKIEKHPNADKLTWCQVRPAPDAEPLPIVCGAPNIKEGDIVPLALVGAKLPGNFVIKESMIRGALSKGMMCSQKELGISEDHAGIWILPKDAPLGKPLRQWLEGQDVILTVEPTPNRGDLLCVLGVARELAAATSNTKVKLPEIKIKEEPTVIEEKADVSNRGLFRLPALCGAAGGRCEDRPQPGLDEEAAGGIGRARARQCGGCHQLCHARAGPALARVRFQLFAQEQNQSSAAPKKTKNSPPWTAPRRSLSSEVLLICDGVGPVAVAGIMGGQNSEVKETTRDILIESAFFNPVTIRRGARKLGMDTEASKRFEHRVDPIATAFACDRASQLMADLAGAKVLKGRLDVFEKMLEPAAVKFRTSQVKRHLGFDVDKKTIINYFERLEMKTADPALQDGELSVTPPAYRADMLKEIDLIEELARMHGYDKIPAELPDFKMAILPRSAKEKLRNDLRAILESLGFSEVINYNFQSPKDPDALMLDAKDPRRNATKISNPLAEDISYMRTSLAPGLIANLAFNLSRQQNLVKIFEFNKIFLPADKPGDLLNEREILAALVSREEMKTLWDLGCPEGGFYEVKLLAERALAELHFGGARIEPASDVPYFLPGKTARIVLGKERAGQAGEIDPRVLKAYDVKTQAFAIEIDFEILLKYSRELAKAEIPSRFPASYRDISFIVAEEVTHQEVAIAVRQVKSELLAQVELFDIYRGEKLPAGKKSMAYRIWYQASDRTLTDDEVSALHAKVAVRLKEKLGAEIR